MWHADSPVTSPSRGGGRTHSNSRADTQQHPSPARALAGGRQTRGGPSPQPVRLWRSNTRPPRLAQVSPGPVRRSTCASRAHLPSGLPRSSAHTPLPLGDHPHLGRPGYPLRAALEPRPRPARPSHSGPRALRGGVCARRGGADNRNYPTPVLERRPGRAGPSRRSPLGGPGLPALSVTEPQAPRRCDLRPPSPQRSHGGLGRGPRSATWRPGRTPAGARLRHRHSPRSRPASPRAPQRLAAMLELVRHRLRQWKERAGGGDPGGGAAVGEVRGAETAEAAPRPGNGKGDRRPRCSPAWQRGGSGGRSEGAEAVGGRGRPPPQARQRRPAPSRRPACRGRCRPGPRRRSRPPGAWLVQRGKAPVWLERREAVPAAGTAGDLPLPSADRDMRASQPNVPPAGAGLPCGRDTAGASVKSPDNGQGTGK